jgi:hypothetical protein
VFEVVAAFLVCELVKDSAAEIPECVDGSLGSITEQLLKFREGQFDGIQVG